MKVSQKLFQNGKIAEEKGDLLNKDKVNLVLGFGAKSLLETDEVFAMVKADYNHADIILCSTAGEIYDDTVYDNTLSLIAIEFEQTATKTISLSINDEPNSFEAGKKLFEKLAADDLTYMMVISDGGLVNGSELVRGIEHVNTQNIPVTGGLAGDADKFIYTLVGCNEKPAKGNIVGIGFYGTNLKIGHGSLGGWDMFGPEKMVTKSESNKLFEIDHKNALDIYKQYLGKYADELPGSALLFPLYVRLEGSNNGVVRTILSIDTDEQSMIFAGDIPEGSYVRFMKANFDKLIDAATSAAGSTLAEFPMPGDLKPQLALLISCVGRKLILGKRTEEEIEAVKEIFGDKTILSGFYSYGEISPFNPKGKCELHNQTMTITTFSEES